MSRPPAPVDLTRVRGALDRLAELYREGVDVPGLLAELEDETVNEADLTAAVSLRLPPAMLAAAGALVEPLGDSPAALAAGGHWGRSAVLRLALARGLAELARDVEGRTDGR